MVLGQRREHRTVRKGRWQNVDFPSFKMSGEKEIFVGWLGCPWRSNARLCSNNRPNLPRFLPRTLVVLDFPSNVVFPALSSSLSYPSILYLWAHDGNCREVALNGISTDQADLVRVPNLGYHCQCHAQLYSLVGMRTARG